MEGKLGEHHSGQLRRESAEAKAERIIRQEVKCQGWSEREPGERAESDPAKLAMAAWYAMREGTDYDPKRMFGPPPGEAQPTARQRTKKKTEPMRT
jgi:hypothetical protein